MKEKVLNLIYLMSILLWGCSKLKDPGTVDPKEALYLILAKAEIKNNGAESVNIYARVPKDAGNIDVTFSATGGKFIYNNEKTVKQLADSISGEYRFARVVLRSDSSEGPKYVTAEITLARRREVLNFIK